MNSVLCSHRVLMLSDCWTLPRIAVLICKPSLQHPIDIHIFLATKLYSLALIHFIWQFHPIVEYILISTKSKVANAIVIAPICLCRPSQSLQSYAICYCAAAVPLTLSLACGTITVPFVLLLPCYLEVYSLRITVTVAMLLLLKIVRSKE